MREFKATKTPQVKLGLNLPIEQLSLPLDLEIGSGTGDFAFFWTQQSKNHLIAIEKTRHRFLKFEKKYRQNGSPSFLWPIHTNAVWWLARYGKKHMFEHIFLLYPNPYPKKKQAHKRWVNRLFMPFLLDLLRPKGKLELRTNMLFYFKEFQEKMKNFSYMLLIEEKKLKEASKAQSLFEKKYLVRGEVCWLLKYQKLTAQTNKSI